MALSLLQSEPAAFSPFLVQGMQNIFKVVELQGVERAQAEQMLTRLPVSFQIKKRDSNGYDSLNEPMEVYVSHQLVQIYPPKGRVVATSGVILREAYPTGLVVRCLADLEFPGKGQVRSVLDITLAYFGLHTWAPQMGPKHTIAIEIHTLYRGVRDEPTQPTPPSLEVRKLLALIAGGEQQLKPAQLHEWRDLIFYAVERMRLCYENPDVPEDYPLRQYYAPCWKQLEEAESDEEYIYALATLDESIKWK